MTIIPRMLFVWVHSLLELIVIDELRIPTSSSRLDDHQTMSPLAEGTSITPLPEKLHVNPQIDTLRKRAITFDLPQSPKTISQKPVTNSTSIPRSNDTTTSDLSFVDPFSSGNDETITPLRRTKSEMLHPYLSFDHSVGRNSVHPHERNTLTC